MKPLKKFCDFMEILFFIGGFCLFVFGIFLKQGIFPDFSEVFFHTFVFPYILISIAYLFSSLGLAFSDPDTQRGAEIRSLFFVSAVSVFAIVSYFFLAYPNNF